MRHPERCREQDYHGIKCLQCTVLTTFPVQQSIHENLENGILCCGLGSAAIRNRDIGDQESCHMEVGVN